MIRRRVWMFEAATEDILAAVRLGTSGPELDLDLMQSEVPGSSSSTPQGSP